VTEQPKTASFDLFGLETAQKREERVANIKQKTKPSFSVVLQCFSGFYEGGVAH
jgi:hypothetical protein